MISVVQIIDGTLGLEYFSDPNPAIDVVWGNGFEEDSAKLVLAVGENASGKSFYRRVVKSWCDINKLECIDLSMERRGSGGIERAFIYGDENSESTGNITIKSVQGAIKTSCDRKTPHVIIWDEPDIGLSESGSLGAAEEIEEFVDFHPDYLVGVFVISHSRTLLSRLKHLPHHFLHFGTEEYTLETWLNRDVQPRSLDEIREANYKRFKDIQAVLNERKAQREKNES